MSKRNQLTGCEQLADKRVVLHTLHFSVAVKFPDETFRDVKRRTSQRIDSFLRYDYDVLSRTRYATHFQVKKFLRKLVLDAIKDAIHRHKEQNNG